jgi:hypothetical protein
MQTSDEFVYRCVMCDMEAKHSLENSRAASYDTSP